MTGEGDELYVPTMLHGQDHDLAVALCDQVATAHVDALGRDLGYAHVTVLKRDGRPRFLGDPATCGIVDQ
jgi:hypothetical protein